jgi:hypothetical protein
MSEQAACKPTLTPAQPASLIVGDRRIQVDEWPLARSAHEHPSVTLVRSNDELAITPRRLAWLKRLIHPLVILAVITSLVAAISADVPLWIIALIVGAMLLLMALGERTSDTWIRFNRESQQLVVERRIGFRDKRRVERAYTLPTILAVQLLYNGHNIVIESHGDGSDPGSYSSRRAFHGYELNLILNDESTPRLNLLCMSDWKLIRDMGRQIGEFLDVLVIDKLYHGS